MRIMVTGGSGFLGVPLIKKLLELGNVVIGVSRSSCPRSLDGQKLLSWLTLDLTSDEFKVSNVEDVDAVIHLAGTGWSGGKRLDQSEDYEFLMKSNELSTLNVLTKYGPICEKIILASSQVVYGVKDSLCVSEGDCLNPRTPYACAKVNSENWARLFQQKHSGKYFSMRFCGFIEGGGFIDYLINTAKSNNDISLFSHGNVCRDYIDIESAVDAIVALAEIESDEGYFPINVGSGQSIPAKVFAKIVCRELQSKSEILLVAQPAPQSNFVYNVSYAKALFNYRPKDIIQTVQAYIKNRNAHYD
ncbi:NAD(P)-dependent oxidoreductase [Gammaproteobacteria bacterium]|nr:NAD(P)-dependent oxidoreductase [Gammaproteobacteria bacterium]